MKNKLAIFGLITLTFVACKKDNTESQECEMPVETTGDPLDGLQILNDLVGIWNGPVTSSTPLGGYPEWIVDFRPISNSKVSAKNELDTLNDIFMSVFAANVNGEDKLFFRNGGGFAGATRASYFVLDSSSASNGQNFYRFNEVVTDGARAYTDFYFRNDSIFILSYTNNYNTQSSPTLHMEWKAKLMDETSAQPAFNNFASYPEYANSLDFSNVFDGLTEAIFYNGNISDPYPESSQPYLGQSTISYSFDPSITVNLNNRTFVMITTQPMFSGFFFSMENMKYRSRYVLLKASETSFEFDYMHPGTYYAYVFYDNDGNGVINSGDYLSNANTSFTLNAEGTATQNVVVNFQIP